MNRNPIEAYYRKCLQTDLPGALKTLPREFSQTAKVRAFQRKVNRRFLAQTENLANLCPDALVSKVIEAYREYYRAALLSPRRAKLHEETLRKRLEAAASKNKSLRWDPLEKMLANKFRQRGYFALFGRVTPFRSLLIWRKQKTRRFKVELSESLQEVDVVFLDQFVELGWLHFATFGRYYVGGWAKKDALYCVSQAYKYNFSGEIFRTSYLTHEAQHFSDYKNFPGLAQADLEFRAKLAELIASRRPIVLLNKFKREANPNPSLPHSYGAHKVLQKVGAVSSAREARSSAFVVMSEHTRRLKGQGRNFRVGALS